MNEGRETVDGQVQVTLNLLLAVVYDPLLDLRYKRSTQGRPDLESAGQLQFTERFYIFVIILKSAILFPTYNLSGICRRCIQLVIQ